MNKVLVLGAGGQIALRVIEMLAGSSDIEAYALSATPTEASRKDPPERKGGRRRCAEPRDSRPSR
jgi:saccharopine dehydrogenase-like NADP-dependent oxidoreductase